MNILHELALTLSSSHLATALSEAAGKSFLVLAAACPLAWFCRRSAAATRHFIWLATLASLLALPVATALAPHWNSPAWAGTLLRLSSPLSGGNDAPAMVTERAASFNAVASSAAASRSAISKPAETAVKQLPWRTMIWPGWAAGVVVSLLGFLARRGKLRSIERAARPVADPEVLELLDAVSREFRLARNVRLLQTEERLMPMTWGCWGPVALLPVDAAKWERERLLLVLRHELAHVRRGDCLTQALAAAVCALYWFNPLAWLAAARMRVERERACDDLVVSLGQTRPSDYAGHLLDIARQWSAAPHAALPVAKRAGLEQRLRALLDNANHHGQMTLRAALAMACTLAAALVALAGWRVAAADTATDTLRQQLIARLQVFSALKEKQAEQLADALGQKISPEFQNFFDAAIRGDGQYVTNRFEFYKQHHRQYSSTEEPIAGLDTCYWSTVLEIDLAYYDVVADEPKYVQEFEESIIHSIPAGSIYFGGTDPGRGLVTAFSRSQPEADPFFTLTQNALADDSYLEYLRRMYGDKIYVPTQEDSQTAFQNYLTDATQRLAENKFRPGEQVTNVSSVEESRQVAASSTSTLTISATNAGGRTSNSTGKIVVSGQVAVMSINGLIARTVFDRNPDREFYIEESYPLDWMFPYLEPHGLILKINRASLTELSAETVQRDQDYWQARVQEMIGGWLRPETPLQTVIDFVDKTYGRKDLSGFTGDPRFVQDEDSQKMFSKLRSSIAGLYAWRVGALKVVPTPAENLAPPGAERQRMIDAADLAFRQAFALCPYSPEIVCRYSDFLIAQGRKEDAIAVVEAGMRQMGSPDGSSVAALAKALAELKGQAAP